jgi:general secretion pathway protein B
MSYILDALRRAEAERERERGAVPGVHAQPVVAPDTAERARPRLPAWWGLAAGGLLGAAVVAGLWLVGRAPAPAPAPPPAPVALAPAPVAPVPAAAPPAAVAPTPMPLAVVSAPVAVASPPPPPKASAAAPAEKPAAPVAAKPQPWGDLSAEQRREWPALVVGGSIYSDNAASRFVMINGQVVREGEAAAPGVTVERIGPKSAVLRFKDRRVELPF